MESRGHAWRLAAAVVGVPVGLLALFVGSMVLVGRCFTPDPGSVATTDVGPRAFKLPDLADPLDEARALIAEGVSSGPLRFGMALGREAAGVECTARMRWLFARWERFSVRLREMESDDARRVAQQLTRIRDCVSCAKDADEACAAASVALR